MEPIVRCGFETYGNREVYVCTSDEKEWFENVDIYDAAWSSALCIASLYTGNPVGCLGYAKWFATSLREIFK